MKVQWITQRQHCVCCGKTLNAGTAVTSMMDALQMRLRTTSVLQCAVGQSGAAAAVAAAAVAIMTQLCFKSAGWGGFVLRLKHAPTEWQANNQTRAPTGGGALQDQGKGEGDDGASTYLSSGSKHLVG